MGGTRFATGSKLPRVVPQDPEAVKREQEVREATKAGRTRSASARELASLREIEADLPEHLLPQRGGILNIDPRNADRDAWIEALAERVAALEAKNKELEKLLRRHYHAHNGRVVWS